MTPAQEKRLARDIMTYITFKGWASSEGQLKYLRTAELRLEKFIHEQGVDATS